MTGDKLAKEITNMEEAIAFLKDCRDIHQQYIDNPQFRRGNVGNKLHHEKCVDRYNETIKLMKKEQEK